MGDWGEPQQARLSYKRYACVNAATGGWDRMEPQNCIFSKFYFYFTQFVSRNLHSDFILNCKRRKEECYGDPIEPDFKEL